MARSASGSACVPRPWRDRIRLPGCARAEADSWTGRRPNPGSDHAERHGALHDGRRCWVSSCAGPPGSGRGPVGGGSACVGGGCRNQRCGRGTSWPLNACTAGRDVRLVWGHLLPSSSIEEATVLFPKLCQQTDTCVRRCRRGQGRNAYLRPSRSVALDPRRLDQDHGAALTPNIDE